MYSVKEFKDMIPFFDLDVYFEYLYPSPLYSRFTSNESKFIVQNPKFIEKLADIVKDSDSKVIRHYIIWNVLAKYTDSLPSILSDHIKLIDRKIGTRTVVDPPRINQCVKKFMKLNGETVSRYFIDKVFPGNAKRNAEKTIKYIVSAYKNKIISSDLFVDETRSHALEKIEKLKFKIGYPDVIYNSKELLRLYGNISFSSNNYFENFVKIHVNNFLQERLRMQFPVDRSEWSMSASDVNAYYVNSF